jgi:Zn-dependent peptidase ImmA (M78 family)
LAHEIGHIVLHEHDVKHFSSDPRIQIKFAQQENSAEWQANTFASHFLIPEPVLASFDNLADLIAKTWVNEQFVLSRHDSAFVSSIRRHTQQAGVCDVCGNFSVTSDGICKSAACAKRNLG